MTIQAQVKDLLGKTGIPAKEINVYGSQIVVTCHSRGAAEKFASVISKFAKIRGLIETYDDAKVNMNTVLRPSKVQVWRVFGVVQ
jgi:hypothetical protein